MDRSQQRKSASVRQIVMAELCEPWMRSRRVPPFLARARAESRVRSVLSPSRRGEHALALGGTELYECWGIAAPSGAGA